ncbi:MAG: ABC transporter ATP-binding protein/permease [Deltaproteobacteria bacterium]|nr:ABC transporter ATP-binding protein/permease [Deltaproteobacteria bacterium]
MAHYNDFGYMEGEHLGKPYDFRLLARLGSYLKPYRRWIVLAAGLIACSTCLDLLLPYLTRLAIDNYIVRQVLEIRPAAAPPELAARFRQEAGDALWAGRADEVYLPEAAWRKLDPRLTTRLRQAGAVAAEPWYLAQDTPEARALAAQRPDLFRWVGQHLLLPARDLGRLSHAELWQLRGPDARGLMGLGLWFALAAALALTVGYSQAMLLERAGQEMMYSMRRDLYAHLLSRSQAFFSRQPTGKLVTRLTNDVQNLNEMFRNTLVALFQDIFLLSGIVVVLVVLDLPLALTCLALTPVITGLAWIFSRLSREAFRMLQGHLGRINSWLSETLTGLTVVKLFRYEAAGRARFDRLNQDYFKAGLKQIRVFSIFMPLSELLAMAAVALIIYYGGGRVVQDRLSLGTLVAFLSYMRMFFQPIRNLAEKYNILQAAMASGERIFQLLDDETALPRMAPPVGSQPGPGEVTLEKVTFGYDPATPVVREVSFTIPAGQTWAVVGPTGAGKSSLVKLIMRTYDPDQGRVTIDGEDLRRMSEADVAARVALVPQEVTLLSGTVADNVALGRPGVTPERVAEALEISGAAAFLEELDQGALTLLGEGGRTLSAGQRQLLSLARALAGGPKVLVLDEATSSVDPVSERLFQEALPRVMAGRTALMVAHRLSTIRHADRILVMQRGRVVEEGRHDELLARGGLYNRLVKLEELRKGKGEAPDDAIGN